MNHKKTLHQSNIFSTLRKIATEHRRKLFFTFGLVAAENTLFLCYPLVGSFAVNAVLEGNVKNALIYALMVLIIWAVGSVRRAVDTRVFVKMYADLAVPVIINERQKGSVSSATAHAGLSRRFVDFFEEHLPILITAVFSVVGSVLMLLMLEFWSGILALAILLAFLLVLPSYQKMNNKLYFKLNNRIENEVNMIERSQKFELEKHYDLLSKIRIKISNREAMSYLCIGLAMSILFGFTLWNLSLKNTSAGHIYAVMTYLWGVAMSLDDIPRLVEKFSELKDIGERVDVNENQDF